MDPSCLFDPSCCASAQKYFEKIRKKKLFLASAFHSFVARISREFIDPKELAKIVFGVFASYVNCAWVESLAPAKEKKMQLCLTHYIRKVYDIERFAADETYNFLDKLLV